MLGFVLDLADHIRSFVSLMFDPKNLDTIGQPVAAAAEHRRCLATHRLTD